MALSTYDEAEMERLSRFATMVIQASTTLRSLIDLRDHGRSGKVELTLTQEQVQALKARYDQLKLRIIQGAPLL